MNLTLNQFEVLTLLEKKQGDKITQRDIAKKCNCSLGVVNKTIAQLEGSELIRPEGNSTYDVTLKGYEWLAPHRVKKAVFLAAGFGSRLVPVTLNTPKPLVKVHGKRIIEGLLDAVLDAGITDITIVRGYLGDQFDVLLKKYPMIKFVENPIYNESNNISSAYLVRDMLGGAYVLESDLLLYNSGLIRKYEYVSNYLGMPVDVTDDWCFETKKGYITKLKIGGKNVLHMFGISFWTNEDAKKLANDLMLEYNSPGGKEKFWDVVALRDHLDHYKVWVRRIDAGEIMEIDTYNELKQIDPIYNI